MSRIDPFDSVALSKNLRGRTVRGGVVTLASQAVLFGVQFVGSVLMARLLTPDDFGLVGMVVAVVGFLETFKDLGLSAATVQEPRITREQVNVLFWFNIAAGAGMTLLAVVAAPVLAIFYGRPELTGVTIMISFGFLISSLAAQQKALLRRSMEFGRIAKNDISAILISVAAGLIAALFGFGYWAIVVQQLVRTTTASIGLWIAAGWSPTWFQWDRSVVPMLRFGGFVAGNSVVNYAARNVDNIAIGWMWGASALGLYTRAYSLLLLPLSQVTTPLANVTLPALSRLRHDPEKLRLRFLNLAHTSGLLCGPVIAITLAAAESVVLILLGDKWSGVASIYQWLGFAAIVQPITTLVSTLFLSQGRSDLLVKSTLINSVISVLVILCALPWGPLAVAGSYGLSAMLIRTPILFYFATKVSRVSMKDFSWLLLPWMVTGGGTFVIARLIVDVLHVTSSWATIAYAGAVALTITMICVFSVPMLRATAFEMGAGFRRGGFSFSTKRPPPPL